MNTCLLCTSSCSSALQTPPKSSWDIRQYYDRLYEGAGAKISRHFQLKYKVNGLICKTKANIHFQNNRKCHIYLSKIKIKTNVVSITTFTLKYSPWNSGCTKVYNTFSFKPNLAHLKWYFDLSINKSLLTGSRAPKKPSRFQERFVRAKKS